MTDFYCDTDAGSDSNDGSTWALAKLTTVAGVNLMSTDGDRLFIQGAAADVVAGNITWTGITNSHQIHFVYGCIDGTTAEPPTDADVCVRGTDTLPIVRATSGGNITVDGSFSVHGLEFDADNSMNACTSDCYNEYRDCRFRVDAQLTLSTNTDASCRLMNCEMIPFDSAAGAKGAAGSITAVEILGGIWNGDSVAFEDTCDGFIAGLDLEAVARALVTINPQRHGVSFFGCGLHASGGLPGSGNTRDWIGRDALVACPTADPSAGASVRDFEGANVVGQVLDETTIIRTGGANDGASGGWSYALTPYAAKSRESGNSLATPWMSVWLDGDNSTAFTLTIYIANDDAGDFNEDEAWVDWLTPPVVASRTWDWETSRQRVSGGSTAVSDDTGSTWGSGGNNHQKFVKTFTPRIAGPCLARVLFAKRYATTPKTCYVDGMVHVT